MNNTNNSSRPLLSIIVASYNYENFIPECLESILNQTYKNVEIVIFDDASTDRTPCIIREYEAKHPGKIKSIFNTENCGPAHSRDRAIRAASGEYITTLDSDDYYIDSRKLEKEMDIIIDFQNQTGKDVVSFSNIVWVDRDKNRLGVWGNPSNIKEGRIFNQVMGRSIMIPRDYVMKKELYFEAGGYDPRFPPYEDWDLKIRLAFRYEFYYTGVEGTAYRQHGKGLSSPPIPLHIQWMRNVFNENIKLEKDESKQSEIIGEFESFIKNLEKRLENG